MKNPRAKVDYSDVVLDEPTERYLATKKEATAKNYRVNLMRYQKFLGYTLGEFITKVEQQRNINTTLPVTERKRLGEDIIRAYIEWMKELGYANNPIRGNLTAVQNMMKYYEVPISFSFIEMPRAIPKKENDKLTWKIEKLKMFLDAAPTYRDKALITFMFQSGLAVGDVAKLNYGDVRMGLKANEYPIVLSLVRKKTEVPFKTLIGADAINYLNGYLKTRGGLKDKDPLFTKWGNGGRITEEAVAGRFREIAGKLDFIELEKDKWNPARPQSLRAFFKSKMVRAGIDSTIVKYWMGWEVGTKDDAYIANDDEDFKELYMMAEKYISIETTSEQVLTGKERGAVVDQVTKDKLVELTEENIEQGVKIKRLEDAVTQLRRDIVTRGEMESWIEAREQRKFEQEDEELEKIDSGIVLWDQAEEIEPNEDTERKET